jgi:carbon-monoxide dehydrogenase medium subunit
MVRYEIPDTIEKALKLLSTFEGKARILAGGTDLLPELRSGKIEPEVLIDITRIPNLGQIEIENDFITIGAAVSFAEIKNHPVLQKQVPMLVQAAASVGAGGIQQVATWVGNIIQAMPAADGAIAAIALEAHAQVIDPEKERWVNVENLFLGPGQSKVDPTRELVAAIRFHSPGRDCVWGSTWKRIGRRSALILPILNCAGQIQLVRSAEKEKISKVVLALGPAGSVPFRAKKAETFLTGKEPDPQLFLKAGEIAQAEASPRSSILRASKEYRQKIIPAMIFDVLQHSYNQSQEFQIDS